MRFTYAETFCDPTFLPPLAQAAEQAGYDSFSVPDSLFFPPVRRFERMKICPGPEDFAALGQPWERRGARLDETIAVVRGLTAGGWFEHHGDLIDVERMKICPVPTEPIPILVGGHAERALRRAATLGDGWLHGGGDPADLPRLLDRLAELRREAGRADGPFEVHVISLDAFSVDGVRRLEETGVTDVVVGFRYPYGREPDSQTLQDKLDPLRRFADEVIARA
jgi:alkanesulfonate monooxygenase SsuD/methylene tetrahydromethanopterin reductase-like flavin-dependent oxidoreductase (luciferase family)